MFPSDETIYHSPNKHQRIILLRNLPPGRFGDLVSVSDGCHGDDAPPESDGDVVEVVLLVHLGEVDEGGEDERPDGDQHQQQEDLPRARLWRRRRRKVTVGSWKET